MLISLHTVQDSTPLLSATSRSAGDGSVELQEAALFLPLGHDGRAMFWVMMQLASSHTVAGVSPVTVFVHT